MTDAVDKEMAALAQDVAAAPRVVKPRFPEPITGILGSPGSGKTHLAGTLIPAFREAVLAKRPHATPVAVNDVWWLQFDRAGSDTLRSYGVEVACKDVSVPPTALVDLFADKPSAAVIRELADIRLMWLRRVNAICQELKRESECRLLVVDSMTAFTRMITDAFICEEVVAQPSDKFDKRRAYGLANFAIGQIVNTLRSLPVAQIWLMHARTAYTSDAAETMDDAARRPIKHAIEIDVQRGVQGAIEPVPSMVLGAKVESDMKGNVSYHLITRPDGHFPIKNRWAVRMPQDTTPDLQRIWDIISSISSGDRK